ncbi:hypothetical protein GCM10017620_30630 [Brevundimonas intermedia]|uniref:DUF4279 domain-containing protein n=1 Tax=Brevundimonas intermedia TaxID=74315 RepID=A0ABQ5TB98_9CAUL|nr:hypothetical protein [Brevundimonas intermedia]GLK50089.1 hypothetical protein GCM10017620_30630 [Brevundimonas intermedia]
MSAEIPISFQVRHPTFNADDLADRLSLPAQIRQTVGQKRSTPTGRELSGEYVESFCSFRLPTKSEQAELELSQFITDKLSDKADELRMIADSGGTAEFYITFARDGAFQTLSPALIQQLAALRVGFALDWY